MSGMVAMFADWVLRKSDDLFTPHSWPWTLLREACFVAQGRSRYSEAALREAGESAETGPLGCLVLAEVLSRFMPALGRENAARGLERLSAADLRHDLSLLLTGNSIVSQCCRALALGLRDMNDAQLDELVKERPAAIAEFLRDCRQRLRASAELPVFEAVAPALDTLWEQGLKAEVVAALEAQLVDPAQAFKDGLAAYRNALGDKSEAGQLFQRAASHGHPGAQYFLGMMYEKGEGVPKDIKVALRYYTQSATNGYDEAAATLGNFYNDGIAVKQDYAEAFVWFSVAAARHHRLAAVLRNSAQRKLTPQELAEARQRVAALLKAMPSLQESLPPSDADR